MSRRRRRRPRDSDPEWDDEVDFDGDFDEDAPGFGSRLLTGCGVGCVALVLVGGAIGLGLEAEKRFASNDEVLVEDAGTSILDEPQTPPNDIGGGQPPPPDQAAQLEDMRRRYRAGPYVRIQSMVPSGQLLPIMPTGVIAGRTVDNPWVVPGGELRPGAVPASTAGGPTVTHDPSEAVGQPLTVLTRTPARALVRSRDAAGGTTIAGYVVEFVGYQGHFYLPAMIPTELGVVQAGGSDGANIQFAIASAIQPDGRTPGAGEPFPVTMRIGAVDDAGRVSALVSRELSVLAVGAGDVEVTLTMGEPTDLDLYVSDPSGVTVYYGNTSGFSGGHLDLDANAACSSNMGVNNEHIYWPAGRAPSGTYRVNVAHYESCISGRAVEYRITVSACGETVVLEGRFDGGAATQQCTRRVGPAERTWCHEIVTFDVPPCGGATP